MRRIYSLHIIQIAGREFNLLYNDVHRTQKKEKKQDKSTPAEIYKYQSYQSMNNNTKYVFLRIKMELIY